MGLQAAGIVDDPLGLDRTSPSLLFATNGNIIPPMVKNMQCSDCERLSLEHQRATEAYLDIIHMHEADVQSHPRNGPQIWDFILDVAVKARRDAGRALEDHQAKHKPSLVRSASMIVVAFLHSDAWEFSSELLIAF